MNEWMNNKIKRHEMNEWTNEWMNSSLLVYFLRLGNERMNEWTNEWMNQTTWNEIRWINEWSEMNELNASNAWPRQSHKSTSPALAHIAHSFLLGPAGAAGSSGNWKVLKSVSGNWKVLKSVVLATCHFEPAQFPSGTVRNTVCTSPFFATFIHWLSVRDL